MRIIKQTSDQLILQNRDASSYSFIALIILVAGLGLLFSGLSSPVKERLVCNRIESNKINCNVTKFYLNGSSINEKINELKGATIKEHYSGKKVNYEVALQSNVSEVSLVINADDRSEKLAATINDFVAVPQQPTLDIQATTWGNLFYSVFAGLLAAGVCSGVILAGPIKTYTFDKNLNQVVFQEKSFIKKEELSFPTDKILGFQVERIDKLYEIILVFKTGVYLRLFTGYVTQGSADKIAVKIENFLGIKKA